MSLLSQYKKRQKNMPHITPDQLNNLRLRKTVIEGKQVEVELLTNEYRQFVNALLNAYQCEQGKNFNIDVTTGEITEAVATVKTPVESTEEELKKAEEVISDVIENQGAETEEKETV